MKREKKLTGLDVPLVPTDRHPSLRLVFIIYLLNLTMLKLNMLLFTC